MSMRHTFGPVLVVSLTSCLLGCGGAAETPTLAPVSGTVEINGKPAPAVTVIFTPSSGTSTSGASGTTGPDGKYELMHRSGELGIEPGTYGVLFSRYLMPDASPVPPGQSPTDAGANETIPERFRNFENPPQTVTVPTEGGTFDLEISMK